MYPSAVASLPCQEWGAGGRRLCVPPADQVRRSAQSQTLSDAVASHVMLDSVICIDQSVGNSILILTNSNIHWSTVERYLFDGAISDGLATTLTLIALSMGIASAQGLVLAMKSCSRARVDPTNLMLLSCRAVVSPSASMIAGQCSAQVTVVAEVGDDVRGF